MYRTKKNEDPKIRNAGSANSRSLKVFINKSKGSFRNKKICLEPLLVKFSGRFLFLLGV